MHCPAGQKSGSRVWERRNGGRGAQEANTGRPTRHEAGDWLQVPGGLRPGIVRAEPEGSGRGAGEGGPYLVLGVLKHVAHAALVLLEVEEDIPHPQGGQNHHEGIERQVPEAD